jgi:hypothetical protein
MNLVYSYAMAFLQDVNWYEIAGHMIDEYELAEPEEESEDA